jgi:hypothetical protein
MDMNGYDLDQTTSGWDMAMAQADQTPAVKVVAIEFDVTTTKELNNLSITSNSINKPVPKPRKRTDSITNRLMT